MSYAARHKGDRLRVQGRESHVAFFREDPTSKTPRKSKSNRSLKTLGDLKEDEARRYFQQLVNVLDYCHSEACTI